MDGRPDPHSCCFPFSGFGIEKMLLAGLPEAVRGYVWGIKRYRGEV
jgi:hypothetical protein